MAAEDFDPDDEDAGAEALPARPAPGALKPVPPSRKPPRFSGRSAIHGTVDFPLKRHESPHGQVTAVSMMKDEAPFLLEWVAHHLAIGFTDLVVYTNDCTDGTDDMLIRLEELGLAHHRRNVIPDGLRPQPSALNHAQDEPVVQASDWVMVFDADEFLSIRHGDGTLDDLIGAAVAQGANGIVVTWRIFGSGGVVDWSRAPVTEQYLMAAPTMWNRGWGVKTLFRFDAEYWKLGIHRPKLKNRVIETAFPDAVHWLNGSGRPMEDYFKFRGWRSITRTVGYDWVQLNHYAVKSQESYALRRLRGNVNNKKDKYNADYWALQDRNEVRDETMLRYHDARLAIFETLLGDPVLAGLHFAAVGRAEARLAELRATPAYAELRAGLAAASAVPISQITAKPPQARDKEKIAALMSEVEKRRSVQGREARKAAPKAPATVTPTGLYVSGPSEAVAEVPLEWVRNHSVELPVDPRVFTPVALPLLQSGRFDRALARRLPGLLPERAKVLEIGAAAGFALLHCLKVRAGLEVVLAEDDPGLRATLQRVLARNGLEARRELRLAEAGTAPEALLREAAPEVLLLADPALAGGGLLSLLPAFAMAGPVRMLFIHGRLLEHGWPEMPLVEKALNAAGWQAHGGFDPTVALGFVRDGA